jgi:cystathionine beta-lyase family protein involved in aluminum resistance
MTEAQLKMYESLGIAEKTVQFCEEITDSLRERFEAIDRMAEYNQLKVVRAMQKARVS